MLQGLPATLDPRGPDRTAGRASLPARQLSRLEDVPAYRAAGVEVLKLQGRSLPPDALGPLVRRFRDAIDAAAAGRPVDAGPQPELLPTWTVVGR